MKFPSPAKPDISILLVLHNRAELTFGCLRSLNLLDEVVFELIIVDNASFDETPELLDNIEGATIIRNSKNEHFLGGANQAAAAAKGRHLLFLNNDAQLLPGAVEAAAECLDSAEEIGAVGGQANSSGWQPAGGWQYHLDRWFLLRLWTGRGSKRTRIPVSSRRRLLLRVLPPHPSNALRDIRRVFR